MFRRRQPVVLLASAILADPGSPHDMFELSRKAGVRGGLAFPIIWDWFRDGWLSDEWEQLPKDADRWPRRFFRLTEPGQVELTKIAAS